MKADFHVHSAASDGALSPAEVVRRAAKSRIGILAMCDHDTVSGIPEAQKEGERIGVKVIAGIELTADEGEFLNAHILGLGIDLDNGALRGMIARAQKARLQQKKEMVEALKKLGYPLSWEEIRREAKGEVTRSHLADAIITHSPEYSREQVFRELLGSAGKAYVKRTGAPTMREAIAAIKSAGGLPVLAHPLRYAFDVVEYVSFFHERGGEAVETVYPYPIVDENRQASLLHAVRSLGLLETAGSDFHKPERSVMGAVELDEDSLRRLLERLSL